MKMVTGLAGVWCTLFLFLPALRAQSGPEHHAGSESWGEPVEGVQLRLLIPAASAHTVSRGLPTLKMQIRNGGKSPVSFSQDMLSYGSGIEIDGVWYGSGPFGGNGAHGPPLLPGEASTMIPLEWQLLTTDGEKLIPLKELNLAAGRHTLRARTFISEGITDSRGRTLRLGSNSVSFETTAAMPTAPIDP
jgi:hypothetical protein